MEELLQDYYEENGKKIRHMVDNILAKFGGIYKKDYDDFYSIANEVMVNVCRTYDNSQNFEGYLYACLSNKIKTEVTKRNREKRQADRRCISIDTPIHGEEDMTIGELLVSDFDMDREWQCVLSEEGTYTMMDERMKAYLDNLTKLQRQIVRMRMEDMSATEIKEELGLSEKQYQSEWRQIKSFTKIQILFRSNQTKDKETMEAKEMQTKMTQTFEKSKQDRLSIASIIKKMEHYTIRFDHPLQRESEQWSSTMKGNLISDILQGNPILPLIFAEQIVNGIAIIWDLDGKQRCTNAYAYTKDGYKIARNVRRYMIPYQATIKDESGKPVLDMYGFPKSERLECDIRGKRFSELPEELQDKFLEYNFEIVQYLNCSGEDIAYHIARYNEGKPMTASQKGITRLGEEFASMVKNISNMPFFRELGGYKVSESNNGTINRVVVESVMASNYLEDWKKKQEDMCEYMKTHAKHSDFDNFAHLVERITDVGTEEVFDMFDSRDSFIWFGLFARFIHTGHPDSRFIEFMLEFKRSLHCKLIGGISFDDLNCKATKDKNVVIAKITHLEALMKMFLDGKNKA